MCALDSSVAISSCGSIIGKNGTIIDAIKEIIKEFPHLEQILLQAVLEGRSPSGYVTVEINPNDDHENGEE